MVKRIAEMQFSFFVSEFKLNEMGCIAKTRIGECGGMMFL